MRLLQVDEKLALTFVDFVEAAPQSYAVLSHTWSSDLASEVLYGDVISGDAKNKSGYGKIEFCIQRIKADKLHYFWLDTCCIDKDKESEVSEAIRSMYKWYSNAKKCYAYLTDVENPKDDASLHQSLRRSRWFTRGWTLQELLAPKRVELFSKHGSRVGTKHSLVDIIQEITGIPRDVILDREISRYTPEQRLSWQQGRQTTKEEDMVYSMLGIFGIHMGIRYGEGRQNAEERLKRKILRHEDRQQQTKHQESRFFVPFSRDSNYIKDESYAKAVEILYTPPKRLALVGLGGVGKSQLAIEYCYDLKRTLPHVWVLWIPSSHAARFDQAVRALAVDIGIPGSTEDTADCFQLLFNWLHDPSRTWVVVLDSLDDAEFLFQAPEQDLDRPSPRHSFLPRKDRHEYIPPVPHGKTVITTRDRAVASKLGFEVLAMHPDRKLAEQLIEKRLREHSMPAATSLLAERLDFIPLAIVQATAFINNSQGRSDPKKYIAMLDDSKDVMEETLGHHFESLDFRRDLKSSNNSILNTWRISFEHLWQTQRSAAYLLALISFYNHQEIPEWLLKAQPLPRNEHPPRMRDVLNGFIDKYWRRSSVVDPDAVEYPISNFEEDIRILRDYSFVEPAARKTRFQMHRLVSFAAQLWLKTKPQQYEWWQEQSLRKLAAAFYGNGSKDRWARARAFYPHAKLVQDYKIESLECRHAQATVLHAAAWFANEKGAYDEALSMICLSRRIFTECRGETHRDTIASMSEQAWTLWNLQELDEQETLQREVFEMRKEVLGPHHPGTLLSLHKLVLTLQYLKREDEAEQLLEESRGNIRPAEQTESLRLSEINSLEVQFWNPNQLDVAETLQSGVLRSCQEHLGEEHQDTMMIMSHLASTYLHQGKLDRAQALLEKCLEGQQRILGSAHPQTKDSMSWLQDVKRANLTWYEAAD